MEFLVAVINVDTRKCKSADPQATAIKSNHILFAMSGHNPHGRLGQPNASYNHLQVPFIPRQPQLAHVHDSILRSSPLNWHQADAAFLNYMSTQHKTVRLDSFIEHKVMNFRVFGFSTAIGAEPVGIRSAASSNLIRDRRSELSITS